MGLLTGQWQTAIDDITQAPQTTHGGMPPCRLTWNTMSSQKTVGGLVKPLSCPTLVTRDAVAIAEQRTYRHVNSQKIDQRLTGNVIQKSINSVNYRLIESRFTSLVFDSIRNEHNYSKFSNTYCHRFLTYWTKWRRFFTLATTPSNQQNLLLTMVQVLYLFEAFILAHYYSPPSTETPTTETIIVQCHNNNWIYLTSAYDWWLLRPMITIRFNSKWKKNTIRECMAIDAMLKGHPSYVQFLFHL